jgi:hypothetical protein
MTAITLIHPQLLIFHFIWYHSWYILHHTCDSPVNSPRPEPSILMIESLSNACWVDCIPPEYNIWLDGCHQMKILGFIFD